MCRVATVLAFWVALAARPAAAQLPLDSLFPERSFDFGTVARGSKIHHTFKLINRTDQEIHIVDSRPKCGCTDVRLGARSIPPGTQTIIEAVVDTTNFHDYKASGLTLVIDRPQFVEVDLNLTCFIRSDITLNPGQIDFGNTQRGEPRTTTLTLSYAGGVANWGIVKMVPHTDQVKARLEEQSRSIDGQVTYLLTAILQPSAKPGTLKDQLTLYTNDTSVPSIPISVTANVQTLVSVSPSIIPLGPLKPGQVIGKQVLVRSAGGQTFKLSNLKSNRTELSAKPREQDARALHVVDLSIKAPAEKGPFHAVLEIASDLKNEPPAKLTIFANVVP